MNNTYDSFLDLVKYPIITEKTIRLLEKNQYCFAVSVKANKNTIKSAVEQLFDVKVVSVKTAMQVVKKRRVGRFIGKKAQIKRAVVSLAPDNTITFFEKE
uniref:ribosomal protein L23 n=1 Tax=Chrysotila carterae TaxID=13221 RepID=UPI0022F2D5FC|nr:ribosomal protein L23 [Chrysotila carterae]WAK83189.1 ribosomal protein L23 [Chrysotila carterae]